MRNVCSSLGDIMSKKLTIKTAKYVLLRGLHNKNKFFSMIGSNETEDSIVRINTGEIVYEIIGYANTIKDAQIKLYGCVMP